MSSTVAGASLVSWPAWSADDRRTHGATAAEAGLRGAQHGIERQGDEQPDPEGGHDARRQAEDGDHRQRAEHAQHDHRRREDVSSEVVGDGPSVPDPARHVVR
jgi:hypothetical protein